MTDAAMASHTSITDMLGLTILQFYDICTAIRQVLDARNKS